MRDQDTRPPEPPRPGEARLAEPEPPAARVPSPGLPATRPDRDKPEPGARRPGTPRPGPPASRLPAGREAAVLAAYLAAGIAVTWPRVATLPGRMPAVRDISSYIWDLWWVAHQVAHLGNPWFTGSMAAPVGIQLGYDTTMPLLGVVLAPITLTAGPAASFWLITIVLPGLLCYVMYRAARLWLRPPGAIAAGALYGLASMLDWQVWFHLNIAAGMLTLPLALAAAVRLRRAGGWRQAAVLGLVLGVSVLINQETALLAGALAAAVLVAGAATGWLERGRRLALAGLAGLAVAVALVVASPQLIAMAQQASSGGAFARPSELAGTYLLYGAQLPGLFGPSPRLGSFGLTALASGYHYPEAAEGVPAFGLALTVAALAGLALSVRRSGRQSARRPWRRSTAWLLATGWLGSAALALGPTLHLGQRTYIPLAQSWHGARVSLLMPYTWLIRVPGLSAFREADRLSLAGLAAAGLLAGFTADRLVAAVRERARATPRLGTLDGTGPAAAGIPAPGGDPIREPRHRNGSGARRLRAWAAPAAAAGLTAVALLEMGWSGAPHQTTIPTAYPALDGPIAADHSRSVVVDVPFGLRGGIPLYGSPVSTRSLIVATADGHPRAISYTSWVPRQTTRGIKSHPFYTRLNAAQHGRGSTPRQLAAARRDARRMAIGWVIDWKPRTPEMTGFLAGAGFRLDYTISGVAVYRPVGAAPATP